MCQQHLGSVVASEMLSYAMSWIFRRLAGTVLVCQPTDHAPMPVGLESDAGNSAVYSHWLAPELALASARRLESGLPSSLRLRTPEVGEPHVA